MSARIHVSDISSLERVHQVSGMQIRAARALLSISSEELARRANVGWATVRRFEEAEGVPISRGGTLAKVMTFLENAGIEFIGDPVASPGVRLRRS